MFAIEAIGKIAMLSWPTISAEIISGTRKLSFHGDRSRTHSFLRSPLCGQAHTNS